MPKQKPHRATPVDKSIIVAEITKDRIADSPSTSHVGRRWTIPAAEIRERYPMAVGLGLYKTQFKLLDDDKNHYYSGWLYNDDEGQTQYEVLKWAEADSGCTFILVKINGEWTQEIG